MANRIPSAGRPDGTRAQPSIDPDWNAAARAAAAHAPGAVPPTEGVPPRSGVVAAASGQSQPSALEDLADALELLRRAARALGTPKPHIEALAERAVLQLEHLDDDEKRKPAAAALNRVRERAAVQISATLEHIATGIETALIGRAEPLESDAGGE